MVNYRRATVPGACYFLTLALQDRSRDWLVRYSGELRESLAQTLRERPFRLPAAVVLPEHLHLLMVLPAGDADFSSRVRRFKSLFVGRLRSVGAPLMFNHKREADVWQRRFWEHLIRDEPDFAAHVDYIHANPLRHGLVERVRDWPLSSFHRYVRRGLLPIDWAGDGVGPIECAGE
ncbi:transposase [Pseudomonas sp. GD04015]|nr:MULTISPECIES: transposase [unclassified Pseudomonas]MDG9928609.1 transposase [Pseudomonas sp. GD04042]MDH0482779.1 transposase [Pseudomonas sp. GD04015]MDH0607156.1 transposase [Pseudomonas sp. GD03869]